MDAQVQGPGSTFLHPSLIFPARKGKYRILGVYVHLAIKGKVTLSVSRRNPTRDSSLGSASFPMELEWKGVGADIHWLNEVINAK